MNNQEEVLYLDPLELSGPEQMAIDLFLLEKSFTDKEDYSFSLMVDAIFDSKQDMALFKLAYGDKPLDKLIIKDGIEAYFE